MQVKILTSWWSGTSLENSINDFLEYLSMNGLEINNVQYRPSLFGYSTMITYK